MIIQLTGLSGAGKSTIAQHVAGKLVSSGIPAEVIDGDRYRKTVCKDLGFSKKDRCENIRRLGKIAAEKAWAGNVVILAAINPYEEVRRELAQQYQAKTVFIDCNLPTLINRDTKGLYYRAMLPPSHPDKLLNLTGVNDTYEAPNCPDLVLRTDQEQLEESAGKLYRYIVSRLPAAFISR